MAPVARKPVPRENLRDKEEFMTQLYEEFHLLMYYAAGLYVCDYHDKEDIVQDCLESLLGKTEYLRKMDRKARSGYIFATVRNAAINHGLHRKVEEKRQAGLDERTLAEEVRTPDEQLILQEQKLALQQIWDKLAERDRTVLQGKYVDELSDGELAEKLGCQPHSVRMYLTRARRAALRLMEREGEGK